MENHLQPPDAEGRAVSAALVKKLHQMIADHGGCLPFDIYMETVLYEPGLGYYCNGLMPFGEQGDYITAPESGVLFGRCLARSIASVLSQLEKPIVLELGAGSGVLAGVVLSELSTLGVLPDKYCILERSAAMRELQQQTLLHGAEPAVPITWLDELPDDKFCGVVVGNEVADALPVSRFSRRDGRVAALGVAACEQGLTLCEKPANESLDTLVKGLADEFGWPETYESEYCPALMPWINTLCSSLAQGALLLVDYGYGRREYYHPQRSMGTLMCHYRHQAHPDALRLPGLQDITAFVDFTSIAEAASDAGFKLKGYCSQAQFLLACGLENLLAEADINETSRYLSLSNEAKRLLLPGEMGERFKCIGVSRGLGGDILGFQLPDMRSRL